MKKRILPALLALVMVLGMLPLSAFAATAPLSTMSLSAWLKANSSKVTQTGGSSNPVYSLTGDVEITVSLKIEADDGNIVFNLNGRTLTAKGGIPAIIVGSGAGKVEITDRSNSSPKARSAAAGGAIISDGGCVQVDGGSSVTISRITLDSTSDEDAAIAVNAGDVTLRETTVVADEVAVSVAAGKLLVDDVAVTGNTAIEVSGAETVEVQNSTLTGTGESSTGIDVKAGKVTITDSAVTADTALSTAKGTVTVNGDDTVLASSASDGTAVSSTGGNVTITAGTVNGKVASSTSKDITVKGGTYTEDISSSVTFDESLDLMVVDGDGKVAFFNKDDVDKALDFAGSAGNVYEATDKGGFETEAGTATFYSVTIDETTNGTVTSSVAKYMEGSNITLTANPYNGYRATLLVVNANDGSTIETKAGATANEYTFNAPASDVIVTAIFTEVQASFTVTAKKSASSLMDYNVTIASTGDGFGEDAYLLIQMSNGGFDKTAISYTAKASTLADEEGKITISCPANKQVLVVEKTTGNFVKADMDMLDSYTRVSVMCGE